MRTTRRQFISRSAVGGFGLIAAPLLSLEPARAGAMAPSLDVKPIVASLSRYYRLSPLDGSQTDTVTWMQVDLGESRAINAIRLHSSAGHAPSGHDFPVRFCIDCSDDPAFGTRMRFADWHARNYAETGNFLARFPETPMTAQYLRLEALPQYANPESLFGNAPLAHSRTSPLPHPASHNILPLGGRVGERAGAALEMCSSAHFQTGSESSPGNGAIHPLGLAGIEILSGQTILTVVVRGTPNLHCPFPRTSA